MSQLQLTQRVQGTVKEFDLSKGYGYIAIEGQNDLFVHYANIEGEGLTMLKVGEPVTFFVEIGANGPQATQVTRK